MLEPPRNEWRRWGSASACLGTLNTIKQSVVSERTFIWIRSEKYIKSSRRRSVAFPLKSVIRHFPNPQEGYYNTSAPRKNVYAQHRLTKSTPISLSNPTF